MAAEVSKVHLVPPDAFERVEHRAHKAVDEARQHFRRLGPTAEALLRAVAPHGPTNEYARQVRSSVRGDRIEVASQVRYATQAEIGRRPGRMPPPREIARRMGLPTDQAFLVARAIGRRGHRGLRPVERAQASMGSELDRAAAQIAAAMKRTVEGVV